MSIKAFGSDATAIKAYGGNVTKVMAYNVQVWGGGSPALPYDAEVEYLQSTGTQWFEIPVKPNESTDAIELVFRRTENTNQQRIASCSSGQVMNIYINGSGRVAYRNGSAWTALSSSNYAAVGLMKHTLKMDYANKVATYDFGTYNISANASQVSTSNLILFGAYSTSAVFKGLIYSVRYWRNGTLLYNLQPVRKDGVGYLYDKIGGGMYGNVGSGSFTIGYNKYSSLSDYTQVDYIQNSTTTANAPYIDVGLTSNGSLGAIDMQMTVKWNTIDSSKRQLFGSSYAPFFGCDGGVYKTRGTDMGLPTPSTTSYDTVSMTTYSGTPTNVGTMALFRAVDPTNRAYTATTYICSCKLKAFNIHVNNVLVRDYVAVLHPANVYGLFDKVENKFYASASSGNFTGGFD